jgi:hypothetical protein
VRDARHQARIAEERLQQINSLLEQKNQALKERGLELERAKALLGQERQTEIKRQKKAEELTANYSQKMRWLRRINKNMSYNILRLSELMLCANKLLKYCFGKEILTSERVPHPLLITKKTLVGRSTRSSFLAQAPKNSISAAC